MLKYTKIELELISDPDMYLFLIESKGGITQVNKKCCKANNKYLNNYNEKENSSYIMYLDANNLYGLSKSTDLPYKDFKWSEDLSLNQIGIYEIDIEIPKNLHNHFKDYPLCSEIKFIDDNMLSDYQKYLHNKLNIKDSSNKLILDL